MQLLDDSDINELDVLEESNTEDNHESVKGMHFTIYHDGKKVEVLAMRSTVTSKGDEVVMGKVSH
jgi:hypothetical protein